MFGLAILNINWRDFGDISPGSPPTGHALTKFFLPFSFNQITAFMNLPLDSRMLRLNREGSFRTESFPMES